MTHDNALPIRDPPELPSLQVEFEGKLMRQVAIDAHPPVGKGASPEIDDNQPEPAELGKRLRKRMLPNAADKTKTFLPAKVVAKCISVDMIEQELSRLSIKNNRKGTTAADIHEKYVIIFCILCAIGKGAAIWDFVKARISDESLPLHKKPGTAWSLESRKSQSRRVSDVYGTTPGVPFTPASNDSTAVLIPGFDDWEDHHKELFIENWQWRLTVPFLEMGEGNSALQHDFSSEVVLPWGPLRPLSGSEANKSVKLTLDPSVQVQGGFGLVESVEIDAECHGFHHLLRELGLCSNKFALKTLKSSDFNNETQFQNEMTQLGRFNGLTNRHFVTLLTCFTQNDKFHFLFPLAECDLECYFERFRNGPAKGPDSIRWFAEQFHGLMEALSAIHYPPRISDKVMFGRHGDLKPDNILWYRETVDNSGNEPSNKPSGLFVISDLGLSALNSQFSRSNIPNHRVSHTPCYRPPECDIDGGEINRSYDIWTIGCIFMEMCVWMLGGYDWLQEFQADRVTTVYLTGVGSNIFFDILKREDKENSYVERVKPVVTEWFDRMRAHKDCSQFFRDLLDIIENQMVIVMSKEKTRSKSSDLARQLRTIKQSCSQDSYCTTPVPTPMPPKIRSEVLPVDADLNTTASDMIKENQPRLLTYSGRSVPPAPSVE